LSVVDEHLKKAFLRQIWLQCRFAQRAAVELDAAYRSMTQHRSDIKVDPALPRAEMRAQATAQAMEPALGPWYAIQALLTAVANISKALWGLGGKLAAEREALRDALAVDDSSPIRPTSMRNNFDHFDDRLDEWWEASTSHNMADLNFGDLASAIQGLTDKEMFRSFNPATGDVVFWGKPYNLPQILGEIARIEPLSLRASI
jgi:hypothetical protein